MRNLVSRIQKIEGLLNQELNEQIGILVNLSKGETVEGKISEKENELQRKLNKKKLVLISVSGLNRI